MVEPILPYTAINSFQKGTGLALDRIGFVNVQDWHPVRPEFGGMLHASSSSSSYRLFQRWAAISPSPVTRRKDQYDFQTTRYDSIYPMWTELSSRRSKVWLQQAVTEQMLFIEE